LSDFDTQFDQFNEVWAEFFTNSVTLPTRSPMTAGPIIPNALLLVDCTAKLITKNLEQELLINKTTSNDAHNHNHTITSNHINKKSIPHDTPAKAFQNIMFTSGVVGSDVSDSFEKQATDALSALRQVLNGNKSDYYHALKCNV